MFCLVCAYSLVLCFCVLRASMSVCCCLYVIVICGWFLSFWSMCVVCARSLPLFCYFCFVVVCSACLSICFVCVCVFCVLFLGVCGVCVFSRFVCVFCYLCALRVCLCVCFCVCMLVLSVLSFFGVWCERPPCFVCLCFFVCVCCVSVCLFLVCV